MKPTHWMPRLVVMLAYLLAAPACAQAQQAQPLDTLVSEHPRLLARQADFDRARQLVKTDELAKQWYAQLKDRGQAMLDEPVTRHELRDGRRMLYESRETLSRVMTLALLDNIEPDDRYRDRIWADMSAAAAFKDWNPDHFLDVAEMALAFALASDWMHGRWTDEQRAVIHSAIKRLAIEPALDAFKNNHWWTRTQINWNQVCNGGLIAGAIAIADDQPELSNQLITRSIASLPLSMNQYAPDGGYDEGPGYWGYGTLYNVIAIAALQSATGKDFGLGEIEGFDQTGTFPLQMTGATGMSYNFSDGSMKPIRSPAMFYLAKRYQQPAWARFAAEHNAGSALDLLWYDPELAHGPAAPLPLGVAYASANVAAMRSAWEEPDAWYIGAKGGWIGHGHSQLDLGSFILERNGVRWLIDLGADDYNLPGYFSAQDNGGRWRYYRNRAEGHNTLVINPSADRMQQHYDADVAVQYADHTIRMDLSRVYDGKVDRAIAMDVARDQVRVTDRLAFESPAEVWWFAHTMAKVTLSEDGRSAVLTQDGKALRARIVSPAEAKFVVMDARPLPTSPDPKGQNPNDGSEKTNTADGANFARRGELPQYGEPNRDLAIRKLAIHLVKVDEATIEVVFESQ